MPVTTAITKSFAPTTAHFSAAAPVYTFPVQRILARSDCAVVDVGFNGTLEVPPPTILLAAPFAQQYRLQVLVTKVYGDAVPTPVTGLTTPTAAPMVLATEVGPVCTLAARYVGPLTPGGFNVSVTVTALNAPAPDFDVKLSGALTISVFE